MNKKIFSVFQKKIESGAPRASCKKDEGGNRTDFIRPASPGAPVEDPGRTPSRWTYDRFMDARMGEIYHEALSRVKAVPSDIPEAESAVEELWNGQGKWFDKADVISRIQKLLSAPSISKFFPANAEIFNEKEFCDASGNLYRMDKVIVMPKEVWVADFKTGSESEGHDEQLKRYAELLKEIHQDKMIRSFIIRVMEKDSREIP